MNYILLNNKYKSKIALSIQPEIIYQVILNLINSRTSKNHNKFNEMFHSLLLTKTNEKPKMREKE